MNLNPRLSRRQFLTACSAMTAAIALSACAAPAANAPASGGAAPAAQANQDINFLVRTDIRKAYAGTAVAIALGGTMMPPDMKVAVSFNLATFRGEKAFAASVVARVSPRIWFNAGAAGSSQRGSTGGRAGVTFGW